MDDRRQPVGGTVPPADVVEVGDPGWRSSAGPGSRAETDAQGNVWTSYFDESSYWFPNPDGTRSYGFMIGLARWNNDGGPPWMAPSHTPGVVWCDCHALNVGRDVVHACPYTDFPLIEIDADGVRSITPNPVTRCSGLAVSGAELAFLDQHRVNGGFRWEIRRARRQGGAVTETEREHLLLPDGVTSGEVVYEPAFA
ncbi:hypothetical protein [Streptosporangium sandarakinum]|uniref:Uncharacterized protein n=1 Tax=Streptosporangium sandarakinum TaxID=1260955 RepID=A0A852V4L2_9ACTN|nr:hypothetical protein [Streptosporangium sandarakinum]NYF43409.1 hypothetical protein [Streptosporangium sandarakinum]